MPVVRRPFLLPEPSMKRALLLVLVLCTGLPAAVAQPHDAGRLAALAARVDSLGRVDVEAALAEARRGSALAARLDSTRRLAQFERHIGTLHQDRAAYDSAQVYLQRALDLFEAVGDTTGQAATLHHLEHNAKDQGDYVGAMAFGLRALRLWEAIGAEDGIAGAYARLSDELYYQERYAEAVAYCRRALAIHRRLDDTEGLATDYQFLGENYLMLEKYDSALVSMNEALALRNTLDNHPAELGSLYNSRGNIFKYLARFDEALSDYRHSLSLILPLNHQAGISAVNANIADVYIRQGRYAEALPYTLASIQIQEKTGFIRNLAENYLHAEEIYEALGQYPEALAYYKKYAATRDSLMNQEKDRVMAELRTVYESERKETLIALQEQRLARQQTIQRFSFGIVALLGVILVLAVLGYRNRRKTNTLLVKMNARLKAEAELRAEAARREAERAREVEAAYDELKTAQARLIQAEKMASLGQLTAGIAHEIKNPLNFVNNFAELNGELADELFEMAAEDPTLKVEDVRDLLEDLKANALRIQQQGQRADGIVRAMMQHARGGSGERERVDLNTFVDEYVNLAYHGARAAHPDTSVRLERTCDPDAGTVELVPQDIGRVLINLLGNAFDAVRDRSGVVRVVTRRNGDRVVIRVEDNGPGIPPEIQDKIFEPFFTTKPTGSGTGLGLSLSFDIITGGHGGSLTVDSTPGHGAAFVVTLPA